MSRSNDTGAGSAAVVERGSRMMAQTQVLQLGRRIATGLRPSTSDIRLAGLCAGAVLVAAILSATLIATTGGRPFDALNAIYQGSIGSPAAWTTTLLTVAPLLVVALGSCISSRSGIFNIGQEGQVLIGAMAAAAVTLRLSLAGPALLGLAMIAAALAGGAWAALSAVMHRLRGVNIVVSTLLMTFVAQQLSSFAVNTPWLLQETRVGYATPSAESNPIPDGAHLGSVGHYPGLQLNVGLLIALVLTVIVAVAMARTRWGFQLKMIGLNPLTARHAGVRVAALSASALALSGGFAGVAGAVLVTSPIGNYRLEPGVSGNVGWDGLLVALVARNRPAAAVPFAVLFGVLRSGGNFVAAIGVPSFLVDVVKGLLVLAFVAPPALANVLDHHAARTKAARSATARPTAARRVVA
jgi:general nucleoside transport system permease protein